MKKNNYPTARIENLVVQELDNEVLVYDLGVNKAFCLNETSALVWQLCNGKKSVSEIADLLSQKLKTLISEEFVWLTLDLLTKDNLLENSTEFEIDFNGLNRRQVIRKIGLASMIALPIVSSVIAPTAAHAQSTNCDSNPVPSGCPIGTRIGISGGCINSGTTDDICNDQYGSTGTNSQKCIGNAVTDTCEASPGIQTRISCKCE